MGRTDTVLDTSASTMTQKDPVWGNDVPDRRILDSFGPGGCTKPLKRPCYRPVVTGL